MSQLNARGLDAQPVDVGHRALVSPTPQRQRFDRSWLHRYALRGSKNGPRGQIVGGMGPCIVMPTLGHAGASRGGAIGQVA